MDKNIDASLKNSMGETAYEICRRTSENCLLFEITDESINKLTEKWYNMLIIFTKFTRQINESFLIFFLD